MVVPSGTVRVSKGEQGEKGDIKGVVDRSVTKLTGQQGEENDQGSRRVSGFTWRKGFPCVAR